MNGTVLDTYQTNEMMTINVSDLSPGSYLRSDFGEKAKLVIQYIYIKKSDSLTNIECHAVII